MRGSNSAVGFVNDVSVLCLRKGPTQGWPIIHLFSHVVLILKRIKLKISQMLQKFRNAFCNHMLVKKRCSLIDHLNLWTKCENDFVTAHFVTCSSNSSCMLPCTKICILLRVHKLTICDRWYKLTPGFLCHFSYQKVDIYIEKHGKCLFNYNWF